MLISDWSADVCSSYLGDIALVVEGKVHEAAKRDVFGGRAGALIEEAAGAAVVAVGRRQIVEAGEIGRFANRADRGSEIGAVRGIQIGRPVCWERVCQSG